MGGLDTELVSPSVTGMNPFEALALAVGAGAIDALAHRGGPLVAILWGRDAQSLEPMLGGIPIVKSSHPSPMSARYGFLGSRPFSRTNELLERQGADPIDWDLSHF